MHYSLADLINWQSQGARNFVQENPCPTARQVSPSDRAFNILNPCGLEKAAYGSCCQMLRIVARSPALFLVRIVYLDLHVSTINMSTCLGSITFMARDSKIRGSRFFASFVRLPRNREQVA